MYIPDPTFSFFNMLCSSQECPLDGAHHMRFYFQTSNHHRWFLLPLLVALALNGDGKAVAHRDHALINSLVLVDFLIEGIQDLGGDVTGSRIDNLSTP